MKKIIIFLSIFLVCYSCAHNSIKVKSVIGDKKELDQIRKIKIGKFTSQNEMIANSIKLTIIHHLLNSNIVVVERGEDAVINGIISFESSSLKTSESDILVNNGAGLAAKDSSYSSGMYVGGINLQVVNKNGSLIGSSYISQTRNKQNFIVSPIELASQIAKSLIKDIFSKKIDKGEYKNKFLIISSVGLKEKICGLKRVSKFKWGKIVSENQTVAEVVKQNITQKLLEHQIIEVQSGDDILISGLITFQYDMSGNSSGVVSISNSSEAIAGGSSVESSGKYVNGINLQVFDKDGTLLASSYGGQARNKNIIPESVNVLAEKIGDKMVENIFKADTKFRKTIYDGDLQNNIEVDDCLK